MRRVSTVGALLLSLQVWALLPSAAVAQQARPGVSADRLREHVTYLASPALEGRRSGEPGYDRAARYVAALFRSFGLKPIGTSRQSDAGARMDRSGYFQPWLIPAGVKAGSANRLQVLRGGSAFSYDMGSDFAPVASSATGDVTADAVFIGYGGQNEDRDDYAGRDVTGKVVVALQRPQGTGGNAFGAAMAARRRVQAARDHGAVALVLVSLRGQAVPRMVAGGSGGDAGIPVVAVHHEVAASWLKASGRSLDAVETALEKAPEAFDLGLTLRVACEILPVRKPTSNVVAVLRGTDPVLRDEYVVVGAHLDHLGLGGQGSLNGSKSAVLHPGADDNASGSAGVLALAEAMSRSRNATRRSIIFMCFSGEEEGLYGSAFYVAHPIVPLQQTVAMINLDMVGRLTSNKLSVIGTATSPVWDSMIDSLNATYKFDITKNGGGFGGSDHQSFYGGGVPVLFFFTNTHPDYHRPTDTADRIDYDGQQAIVSMAGDVVRQVADAPVRPGFAAIAQAERAPRARARTSLGTIPDYGSERTDGVLLSGVRQGSSAEKAGLKGGDLIVKIGAKSIRSMEDFMSVLGELRPGVEVEVVVKRGSSAVTLKVVPTAPSSSR